jgi:succinate dehydrogenase/fumarate reductase flavoprotein subunit
MGSIGFLGKKIGIGKTPFEVLIAGTGAAGYNAAIHLHDRGVRNFAILTEDRLGGTSRNTGSDKQTYYKMACAGEQEDSPRKMAETLFSGGAMDGDLALCEAAHSLEEFFHLAVLGVPFPHNRYGEFPGYKTDHDPLQRASSSGPYTSKYMTERLEAEVLRRGIPIIDKNRVIKLLVDRERNRVYGALCLEGKNRFRLYFAENIIFATGGPAGLYRPTVYPPGHFGASGVLAREGVEFANITEWQYGIGSLGFRWNLSGSFQQVIPRYVAVDPRGGEEEFLCGYFSSIEKLGAAVFLKGYQWPFDPAKIGGEGSSLIDAAIYIEKHLKGKRIYLDFTHNPGGNEAIGFFDLSRIDKTAQDYLARSGALEETPIKRLLKLNPGAYELYKSRGINLEREYVEIDVLPQHHNGGAAVSLWWETSIKHLFAVGECAGTHGIRRPGGSALNAGQVGGLRAALYIAGHYLSPAVRQEDASFHELRALQVRAAEEIRNFEKECTPPKAGTLSPRTMMGRIQDLNTAAAAFIRNREKSEEGLGTLAALAGECSAPPGELDELFRVGELLLFSRLLHESIIHYIAAGGKSRGSYLIAGGTKTGIPETPESFLAGIKEGVEIDSLFRDRVLLTRYDPLKDRVLLSSRPARPIPPSDTWFERVWHDYEGGDIFSPE